MSSQIPKKVLQPNSLSSNIYCTPMLYLYDDKVMIDCFLIDKKIGPDPR